MEEWEIALEKVMLNKSTSHEPFVKKCSNNNTNIKERDFFRRSVILMSQGLPLPMRDIKRVPVKPAESIPIKLSPEPSLAITGHANSLHKVGVAEWAAITRERNGCQFFVKHSGCGCNRSRCLGGKQGEIDRNKNDGSTLINLLDCAVCLRPDEPRFKVMRDGG